MPDVIAKLDNSERMYCTVADVSTRYDIKALPKLRLENLIRACTARIETYCNRVFMRVPHNTGFETRKFLGNGLHILPVDDLLEVNTITCDGEAVDLADLILMPYDVTPTMWLEYDNESIFVARTKWEIDGVWGYSETIPPDIYDACIEYVIWALARARQGYQDVSANENTGQLTFSSSMPMHVRNRLNNKRRNNV
jgi:hypothetical protein